MRVLSCEKADSPRESGRVSLKRDGPFSPHSDGDGNGPQIPRTMLTKATTSDTSSIPLLATSAS